MLSWLDLLINRYCYIYLVVYITILNVSKQFLPYVVFLITSIVQEFLLCFNSHAAGFNVVLNILEYKFRTCVSERGSETGNLGRSWNEEVEAKAHYPIGYGDRDTPAPIQLALFLWQWKTATGVLFMVYSTLTFRYQEKRSEKCSTQWIALFCYVTYLLEMLPQV